MTPGADRVPPDERVLVIPTARLDAAGRFHGLRRADPNVAAALLDPAAFAFRPRSAVESDPAFKQLIPYVVLRCGGEVFHYRRGPAGTEARLTARRSVGVGGHISEADAEGPGDPYRAGLLRELAEEVDIGCGWAETFLGLINDDRTPVGQVHLGVVHVLDLERPAVAPREAAVGDAGFAPVASLAAAAAEFETWSQFVLAELAAGEPTRT